MNHAEQKLLNSLKNDFVILPGNGLRLEKEKWREEKS